MRVPTGRLLFILILTGVLLVCSCGGTEPTAVPSPVADTPVPQTQTSAVKETATTTDWLSATAAATATAAPTATPSPTNTAAPPTPAPTPTSEPSPTATTLPPLTGSGGGVIVFGSNVSAGYNREIYAMNADGTAIRRLTQHPADDSEPVWSPAGAASMGGRGRLQIAFVSERDGNKEIYILDLDEASQTLANHGLHRLTHNSADDYSPTWSPDGTQIAFVSERHGNPEIYVLNVAEAVQDPEGVAVRRLTRNNARERDPDWAPAGAGEQIAFASDRDGNWEIYAKSPGGGGESATRRLTHREENDTDPAWSPDGTSIAFSSSDKNSIRIYVMNSEGDGQGSTEPKQLTSNQEQAFDPVWSPDGDRILYSLHNVERDPGLYIVNRDGSQQRYLSEAWGGYYQDWRTYPQGPVAGEPPLKPGPVVDAPRADTPRIDGTLNAEEWAEAYRVEIDASRELLLMHDGAYWYLGIRSPDVGLGSLCVDRGSQVAILHASAALGTALYDLAGGSWQPVQDFSWRCRSTSDSSYAQQEREEFLAENDWLGTNVNLGTAGELEYQIAVDGESVRLAVSYLAQADEDRVIQWPTGLDDDCGRLRLVQGYTPENLRFLPETWVTVRAAP